jgi:hypothetical protein
MQDKFTLSERKLVHRCHCGRWGGFGGIGYFPLQASPGTWYCYQHKPEYLVVDDDTTRELRITEWITNGSPSYTPPHCAWCGTGTWGKMAHIWVHEKCYAPWAKSLREKAIAALGLRGARS